MVQSDKLKKIIAEVKEESSPVITLSNELIADFSKELDSAISELDMIMESIGENSIEDIPDSQIEYYCVKIPALMYYAGQRVEELGMQVDLASNAKKSAQNEAMVKVSGTVQEKKARVEQLTEDKALVEAIAPRYIKFQKLYEGKHKIQNRPRKDKNKPNNKLVNDFFGQTIDNTVGYFLGNPIVLNYTEPKKDSAIKASKPHTAKICTVI